MSRRADYSPATAVSIDQETKAIVTRNYGRARDLLETNKRELVRIAEELMIREVLDAEQVRRIAKGLPVEGSVPVDVVQSATDGETDHAEDLPIVTSPLASLDKAIAQE
jgi:cell division protease FtsH